MSGIVVGVDQSAQAHDALGWAMREAATRQADLTVITVIPAMASPFTGNALTVPNADTAVRQAKHAAEEAIAKSAGPDEAQPSSITVRAFTGFPARALISASRDADLLVVGAHGQRGIAATLLGAVSRQVTRRAACPVVVVPSGR